MTKTNTFRENLQRATPETCELWEIWSEWWGDMAWQKKTKTKTMTQTMTKTIPETYDIWDTDYNSDNWEPEFMTIFVVWQLRVTLDSIRNSCDVYHTTSRQPFISFSPKSKQLVDPPLFGRLSTKGYPSIGGQGSSTCTWSGTTWNPSSFECFKGHLPFLVPDLVFVLQVADNFCFPRQSPDLKEEVEVF